MWTNNLVEYDRFVGKEIHNNENTTRNITSPDNNDSCDKDSDESR